MYKGMRLLRRAKQSVFIKIGALFLATLMLATCILLVFSNWYFRQTTEALSHRIRSQTDLSLQLTVNKELGDYASVMYQAATDADLRNHLRELNGGTAVSASFTVQLIANIFNSYLGHSRDILALTAISNNNIWATQDATRWQISRSLWEPDQQSGALAEMIRLAEEERRVLFIPDERHPDGSSFFHVVLCVWDYYSRESMGTLVMTVDAAGLWRLIGSMAAEEYAFDFLMHADGRLLVHPDYARVGSSIGGYRLDTERMALLPDGTGAKPDPADGWRIPERAEIQVKKLDRFDIYLISVLDNAMYQDLAGYYAGIAAIVVVGLTLLVILFFMLLLRRQTEDIHAVIDGIEQMRDGRMDVRIKTKTKDEIYDIAQTFNASLQSLEIITQERDEEMQRFLQESERRRKAEVRSLQAQINSHFLYNTLNVINYTAIEGDTRTTSRMLKSLADCLFYTLNQNLDIVPLREEIAWLEKYLLLQKERQPSLFDYRIDVGEGCAGLPVHKLVIQPFVENAIVHGFAGCESGRDLYVGFRRLEAPLRLVISIYDDGVGMCPEKLSEIQDLVKNYEKADGLGIGIENSCFRLSTHYKAGARIFVRSAPDKGTRFNIVLPLDEDIQANKSS